MTFSFCSLNVIKKIFPRAKIVLSVKIKIHPRFMQKPQERNKVICCKPLIQDELQKISFNCHYEGLK